MATSDIEDDEKRKTAKQLDNNGWILVVFSIMYLLIYLQNKLSYCKKKNFSGEWLTARDDQREVSAGLSELVVGTALEDTCVLR